MTNAKFHEGKEKTKISILINLYLIKYWCNNLFYFNILIVCLYCNVL